MFKNIAANSTYRIFFTIQYNWKLEVQEYFTENDQVHH